MKNKTFLFILSGFAVYRLSRYLPFDVGPYLVFEKIRDWSASKRTNKNDDFWAGLDDFINCPYCEGPYIALLISALILRPTKIGNVFLMWAGLTGIQDFLETIARRNTE